MNLEVSIRHALGDFIIDVSLSMKGPASALFGASGAGKTTILNAIAGLVKPAEGRIVFNGEVWCDTGKNIFVPAHLRRIGYVFQEGRLFPHMSVRKNLLYGWKNTSGATLDIKFDEIVELLGIRQLLERKPAALSGGETQRAAIARALLSQPQLLLMDEPLASLDEKRKLEVLPYIEKLRDRFALPIMYVSHSRSEAERIANEFFVIDGGKIIAPVSNG